MRKSRGSDENHLARYDCLLSSLKNHRQKYFEHSRDNDTRKRLLRRQCLIRASQNYRPIVLVSRAQLKMALNGEIHVLMKRRTDANQSVSLLRLFFSGYLARELKY